MITFPDGSTLKISRKPIGIGGEGKVYRVANTEKPGLVAKIYKQLPSRERQSKIEYMSRNPELSLREICAWPLEPLYDSKSGLICGFTMQDVSDSDPVHHFYSPGWRRRHYPKMTWGMILGLCSNISAVLSHLHALDIVAGDINPNSIRITKNGKAVFIDADSFQLTDNGRFYCCGVGVPAFTPPELLEKGLCFEAITRTKNHDNFSLALILFHLLFMGRHPYSGVPLHDSEWSLEENIKNYRYAYSHDTATRGITPPSLSVQPKLVVGQAIVEAFQRAFTQNDIKSTRPDARLWHSLTVIQRQQLRRCETNFRHSYDISLKNCIWCALETKGVLFFASENQSYHPEPRTKVGFRYATLYDIQSCTGKTPREIRDAIEQLKCTEPFDLITADRLALILTGDASIKRSYDTLHTSHHGNTVRIAKSQPQVNTASTYLNQNGTTTSSSKGKVAPTTKGVSYSTRAAVSFCTGRSEADVQIAMDQLGYNEPFDLIMADRLAYLLTGDASIWRAHAKYHNRKHAMSSNAGKRQAYPNIYSSKVGATSNNGNTKANSGSNTTKGISYSTKSAIITCTGRSEKDVQDAIDQLKCKEPFDLVTADRLAYILTGDPSIWRASLKRKSS
jgi:serine/threonine protein kinase